MKPNFLVILMDDLRYDEYGAGGHPCMKTPHIDRMHTKAPCSSGVCSVTSNRVGWPVFFRTNLDSGRSPSHEWTLR